MAASPVWLFGCKTGQDIWKWFTDPAFFTDPINFGSPAEALSTLGAAHRPPMEGFLDVLRGEDPGTQVATDRSISQKHREEDGSWRVGSARDGWLLWEILLA